MLTGCRAVPDAPETSFTAAQENSSSPTLTVASLDNSIPLGDSFPVAIDIRNALPNDALELELTDSGVTPSTAKLNVTTDSSGNAQVQLSARATQPVLAALHVLARGSGEALMGTLYVNFEKPYVAGPELSTQASRSIGEPLTIDDYYDTLPVAKNEAEIRAFNEDSSPPSAYILDGVLFKNVDGKLKEPLSAVVLDSGTQSIDGAAAQTQPSLTAQACTVRPTFVTLKTMIDGRPAYHIKGTRVRIDTLSGPVQVRYVGDYGRVDFNFGCNGYNAVDFEVDAWTTTGMYIHTGKDALGRERIFVWKKNVNTGSRELNADTIRGTVVQTVTDIQLYGRDSQRLFWRMNQVYDWERRSHSLYDTFPLDIYYPYVGVGGLSGVGRTHIPALGALSDPLIFHEFGHEVYYRRMLGGAEYGRLHQDVTLRGGPITYPPCLDALGWNAWNIEGHCAGMLEGFAVWFEIVATRALGTKIAGDVHPEYKPTNIQSSNHMRPGSVAQFLLDITDSHSGSGVLQNDEPLSIDPVRQLDPNIRVRYRNTAQFFHHGQIEFGFLTVWDKMFKPRLPASELRDYCVVKKYNLGLWSGDGC